MGIVVIGAVFVDIKGLSPFHLYPRRAQRRTHRAGTRRREPAWWRISPTWSCAPTFVGLVDDTGMGQDVIDKLARHKVNTRFIQKSRTAWAHGWPSLTTTAMCAAISKRPDTTR